MLLLPFDRLLTEDRNGTYTETLSALEGSSMSVKEAAARLGIHRNTVLFRLKRIRELSGLDPVNRSRDRRIVSLLLTIKKRLSSL